MKIKRALLISFSALLFLFVIMGLTPNKSDKVTSNAFGIILQMLLDHSVQEISVNELVQNIDSTIILDAREHKEYAVSHLPNAQFIGYSTFNLDKLGHIDVNEKIVVYCSLGKRSENIAKNLNEAGYKNVKNLYGGIFEWKNQNNPVYSEGKVTNQVHAYDRIFGVWLKEGEKVFD